MQRRDFLRSTPLAAASAAGLAGTSLAQTGGAPVLAKAQADGPGPGPFPGHEPGRGIPVERQSVSRWCYGFLELEALLPRLRELGLSAIDLIRPSEFATLKAHGFTCSMAYGREQEDITTGFIDEHLHDQLVADYTAAMPKLAEYGYRNLVCFAGNRRGRYDLDGLRVAARGLRRLMPAAREHGVTLQMEAFNSRVNHPDYMGDSTAWLVTLVDMVDSEHFRILWDIYHMQVQEGNVIQSIRDYGADYFGHYHTAGVPGRHELNAEQELYYPAVMRAIRETGFEGYVAHEFVPTYEDKLAGLAEAIRICA